MSDVEERYDPEVGRARGVLRRDIPAGKMYHSRRRPSSVLSQWIMHYWLIEWDLRDCEPQLVENTPHPNIHLIFDDGKSEVLGVQTGKFSRVLAGEGRVFGIKFRAGGFRPFIDFPVSQLMDRRVAAKEVFGETLRPFESVVFSPAAEDELVRAADDFFAARLPDRDPTVQKVGDWVDTILTETDIKTVEALAARVRTTKRTLQRIFSDYVGAAPKWVIRRYRLHDLIEKIHSGAKIDWAEVAVELGYFDQAHMSNDFKSIVGYSPTDYQRQSPHLAESHDPKPT